MNANPVELQLAQTIGQQAIEIAKLRAQNAAANQEIARLAKDLAAKPDRVDAAALNGEDKTTHAH